jgi:hypothetical protein
MNNLVTRSIVLLFVALAVSCTGGADGEANPAADGGGAGSGASGGGGQSGAGASAGTGGGGQSGAGASAGTGGGGAAGSSGSAGGAGSSGSAGGAGSAGAGGTEGPMVSPGVAAKYEFDLVYDADFSDPSTLTSGTKWRVEDMGASNNAAQHRDAEGRRHAAWYDRHHDQTMVLKDGYLVQRGFVADSDLSGFSSRDSGSAPRNWEYIDPDPRDAAKGAVNFADFELHTSWLDTFALKYSSATGGLVPVESTDELVPPDQYHGQDGKTDTLSPNLTFPPGTFFEIEVNFDGMKALAHRHSFWLMPAVAGPVAYDSDPANGVEIDIYEHEMAVENSDPSSALNDILLMKCIGGNTTPSSTENELLSDKQTAIPVSNINVGWHKIGLLWTQSELIWFVDGVEKVRDSKLVPTVNMFIIVSREANTGARDPNGAGPTDLKALGENIPLDPGLFGRNVATPANRNAIKAGEDDVKVRYVRAWSISDAL